jgi:hypothetical protein
LLTEKLGLDVYKTETYSAFLKPRTVLESLIFTAHKDFELKSGNIIEAIEQSIYFLITQQNVQFNGFSSPGFDSFGFFYAAKVTAQRFDGFYGVDSRARGARGSVRRAFIVLYE